MTEDGSQCTFSTSCWRAEYALRISEHWTCLLDELSDVGLGIELEAEVSVFAADSNELFLCQYATSCGLLGTHHGGRGKARACRLRDASAADSWSVVTWAVAPVRIGKLQLSHGVWNLRESMKCMSNGVGAGKKVSEGMDKMYGYQFEKRALQSSRETGSWRRNAAVCTVLPVILRVDSLKNCTRLCLCCSRHLETVRTSYK